MLAQTVLPFKLEASDETLTAHGAWRYLASTAALGLAKWLDQALPASGGEAGYAASSHAQSLILMLHGGGQRLEDLRTLRADAGLRALLGPVVPSIIESPMRSLTDPPGLDDSSFRNNSHGPASSRRTGPSACGQSSPECCRRSCACEIRS